MDPNFQAIVNDIQKNATHTCDVIMPFPEEITVPDPAIPSTLPATFRLSMDYKKKLKECKCFASYRRYKSALLQDAYQNGTTAHILPRAVGPPSGTDITFFNKKMATYKIGKQDLQEQLNHAKTLPDHYNWMVVEKNLTPPRSQAMCSSCYAFSVADCLSDLYVIKEKIPNPNISPTYILSCYQQGSDAQCQGGGDPVQSIADIKENGIGTYDCLDYSFCGPNTACGGEDPTKTFQLSEANALIPPCACKKQDVAHKKYYIEHSRILCIPPKLDEFSPEEQMIINGYLGELYKKADPVYSDLSTLHYKDIQALIKQQIYNVGPVIGGFHVFKNFFRDDFVETKGIYVESSSYLGIQGVDYEHIEDSWYGSHAVVIVGWGKDTVHDEVVDYWIVRNSWGPSWGEGGYFKIAMYGNEPGKRYQNRLAQFEYPTVLLTSEGIAITGGVIMITPGKIEEVQPQLKQILPTLLTTRKHISGIITSIVFLLILAFLLYKKTSALWIISITIILLSFMVWLVWKS